jgi:hypothetical protein
VKKNYFCYSLQALLRYNYYFAEIAQLVEQWTENPRVTSSNLVLGIRKNDKALKLIIMIVIILIFDLIIR